MLPDLSKLRWSHFLGMASSAQSSSAAWADAREGHFSATTQFLEPNQYNLMDEAKSLPTFFVVLTLANLLVYGFRKCYPEFSMEHFVPSLVNLMDGRPWAAVLGMFSHASVLQMAVQLFVFWKIGELFSSRQALSAEALDAFILGTILTTAYLPLAIEAVSLKLFPKAKMWRIEMFPGFWGVNAGLLYLLFAQLPDQPARTQSNAFMRTADSALRWMGNLLMDQPLLVAAAYAVLQAIYLEDVEVFNLHLLVGWLCGFAARQILCNTEVGKQHVSEEARRIMAKTAVTAAAGQRRSC